MTNQPPNPNCKNQKDVFDGNGNYIKTICLIDAFTSYDMAIRSCRELGMRQYTTVTELDYTALQDFYVTVFGDSDNAVWISGSNIKDGTWYTFTTEFVSIYSGAVPTIVQGECLMYGKLFSPPSTRGYDCDSYLMPLCEYSELVTTTVEVT